MTDPFLEIDVPRRLSGVRFDRALDELVPDRSRSQLQKLVRKGRVRIDGKLVLRSNFNLAGGERVHVELEAAATPPALPFELVHVEDVLAVVDKPPGMLTHPTERFVGGTLAELASLELGPMPSLADEVRPGIVHRLDRETSGLLVLARTPDALDRLRDQFRARTVEKRYLALVYGQPDEDEFVVDQPLAPVPGNRDLQRIDRAGRDARTTFRVLERHAATTLLECAPVTGRRHQLRVHLWHAGHPIVGDKLYRPGREHSVVRAPHHALHAAQLTFDHPVTGARMSFRAEPPESFFEGRR